MRILKFTILLLSFPITVFCQNLRTVEVYFDPLTMTKIQSKYTIETTNHQKHGNYKEWDEYGYLIKDATFSNGKLNGTLTTYFGASYLALEQVKNKNLLGKVATIENYKNGLKHGIFKQYYLSDTKYYASDEQVYDNDIMVKETVYYESGKRKQTAQLNGLCDAYYENGSKYMEFNQKNGKEDGLITIYYENGQIMSKGQYINGVKVGKWNSYYKNGQVANEESFLENYGITKEQKQYATTGALKYEVAYLGNYVIRATEYDSIAKQPISIEEFRYKITQENIEVLKHGKSTYYYYGNLVTEGMYQDGIRTGKWKIFNNKDGKETVNSDSVEFYREITFDGAGLPVGKVIDHYKTGQKQWEGTLLSLNPNKFDGECIYYFPNGQVEAKQHFNKNIKMGTWEVFYENGKDRERCIYSNNVLNGLYTSWWDNGKTKITGNFKEGNKIGEWKFYNENGGLVKLENRDEYGNVTSKTAQQLLTDIQNQYKDTVFAQNTELRQKYLLNRPEDYQELVGNSYTSVFKYFVGKVSNSTDHESIVDSYKRLIIVGRKLLKLDDPAIKKLSRKLKNQTDAETIIRVINDFSN